MHGMVLLRLGVFVIFSYSSIRLAYRLPPRGALQKPRARSNTPTGANKALLGELMRREEGVGLVFLSMFVVGVDITAQVCRAMCLVQ